MKKILLVATALILALTAGAVRAKHITRTFTQPDGSSVTLTLVGDERCKYYLTTDGVAVLRVGDEFRYADVDAQGHLVASQMLACEPGARSREAQTFVSNIDSEALGEAFIAHAKASQFNSVAITRAADDADDASDALLATPQAVSKEYPQQYIGRTPDCNFPNIGSPKVLVILVSFADLDFTLSNPSDYFTRMLTEHNFSLEGGTGSALDYFTEMSGGLFTPRFDVYGPVELPHEMAYYGGNNRSGNDSKPYHMIADACTLLDPIVNFKDYDTDNDGMIDNVYVFYAGMGEASGGSEDTIWPHQWDVRAGGVFKTLDGVSLGRYACSNEWEIYLSRGKGPDGIGTFVHEFSHVMGLPDLYVVSGTGDYTPCEYSVLDYGPYNNDGRTPPGYSLFERNAMGWYRPYLLDKTGATVTLGNLLTTGFGCMIPTSLDNEFFLLENRQQQGWDNYLPGHGMLIWHIDYDADTWRSNAVNDEKKHQRVDIEEANNNPKGSPSWGGRYSKYWTFPSQPTYTSFTDTTTPNMKAWKGLTTQMVKLNMPITGITEVDGVITFNICGGGVSISGIGDIEMDDASANTPARVQYYDLQGRRVNNPGVGVYIVRQGARITKVVK